MMAGTYASWLHKHSSSHSRNSPTSPSKLLRSTTARDLIAYPRDGSIPPSHKKATFRDESHYNQSRAFLSHDFFTLTTSVCRVSPLTDPTCSPVPGTKRQRQSKQRTFECDKLCQRRKEKAMIGALTTLHPGLLVPKVQHPSDLLCVQLLCANIVISRIQAVSPQFRSGSQLIRLTSLDLPVSSCRGSNNALSRIDVHDRT